ncbi:MAG: DUF4160 domain-containing protein [Candidatus Aminicenantes bacterium]|nr:DUF4160 domain-containing protein [Candidatus Aminicenantes bacterium]
MIGAKNPLDYVAQRLSYYFASCRVLPDGTVIETKVRIAQIDGFIIEVFPKEHAPPHFHVRHAGKRATYRIDNCDTLEGSLGTNGDKFVKYCFEKEGIKELLIEIWNRTRPGDCSIGKYGELDEE